MKRPRCIATPSLTTRCRRPASSADGLWTCDHHARCVTRSQLDCWLSVRTRRMLAFAEWETLAEGQRLIDRIYKRAA